jgi:hypothetical protein
LVFLAKHHQRYIESVEACWHINEFAMHAKSPNVYHLPAHLSDEQMVYFNAEDDINEVLERGGTKTTHLTAWFEANQKYEAARNVTYQNFPRTWVYNAKKKAWGPRQCSGPAVSRMYFASPAQGERFYLRILLTVITGTTSFQHLCTVNGIVHPTFKQACVALGLLQDDQEWIQCLTEASQMQLGSSLRSLFAIILLYCNPTSPGILWQQFRHHICDDLRFKLQTIYPDREFTDDEVYTYGLHLIDKILNKSDKSLADYPEMPAIEGNWHIDVPANRLLHEQRDYDIQQLQATVAQNLQLFNQEQRQAYDDVMDSVINNKGKIIFLHSAGGCGKTFVCNTIAVAVRAQGKIALCAASSGIAALLLEGGWTAYSTFRTSIEIHEASGCKIPRGSKVHQLLEQTSLCIWDEIPMQHKYAPDAVDRTIRDLLHKNNKAFGGITMLFGGDFRQTLPIIQRGSRKQIIAASIRQSRLWQQITVHHLHQNMRLNTTPENITHAAWLLDIGAGRTVDKGETIEIPQQMLCHDNTMESLISSIYPGIEQGNHPDQCFLDRTILSCTNDNVDGINSMLLTSLSGAEQVFNSADTVSFKDQELNNYQPYPTEYLNSLRASGLPLSQLALKAGCPLMLLQGGNCAFGTCVSFLISVICFIFHLSNLCYVVFVCIS